MSNKTKIIAAVCLIVGVAAVAAFFLLSGNKTYNVSFDTNGGSYAAPQVIKKGDVIVKPTNPTREGYNFVRWELDGREYDFTTPIESDAILKAIWEKIEIPEVKYKVTFTLDGKKEEIEVSSISESDLKNLGFEEKNGYVIKWYVDGKEYDLSTPLTSDVTIEGKYEKIVSYTVKFNSDGGTKISNQIVNIGEKAQEPTDVKKEGYIFDAWYLNGTKYDFDAEVTKNITLTAKWKEDPSVKRYEVKFNSDGGSSVSTQRIIENKVATQPKNPTKSGYLFDGWYLENEKYVFSKKVTKDITLVAKWKVATKYTVTFDSDGGSSVPSQTVAEGGKATRPSKPTRNGYTFKEWQLDNNPFDFENTVIKKDITLVAEWIEAVDKYVVTFKSQGGSSVPSQTVEEGSTAKRPSNPTKDGAVFKGWLLNGSTFDFSNKIYENITLIADWDEIEEVDPVVQYTVSFNSNGGSSVPSQKVNAGSTATRPTNPTKSGGSTFKRWVLNNSEYTFREAVNSDIILVAEWDEIPKTYTFKVSMVDDQSPDRIITVYEDGTKINFSSIKVNGNEICTGSNPTVNKYQIKDEMTVVLTNGKTVTARKS